MIFLAVMFLSMFPILFSMYRKSREEGVSFRDYVLRYWWLFLAYIFFFALNLALVLSGKIDNQLWIIKDLLRNH